MMPIGPDDRNSHGHLSVTLIMSVLLAVAFLGCAKESPEALLDSAKAYAAAGDYKAAAIQLRNLLQTQPQNAEARYLLGQALSEAWDYLGAEKELRRAVEYGYARDGVYPALARVLLGQGNAKQLIDEFKSRTLTDPEAQASLKTELGLAYIALGQRDAAGDAFAAALKSKPGYGRARVGQATLVATGPDAAGAMKLVDDVLAASPVLPEALALKADLLVAQNDTAGASKLIEQIVKAQPNNLPARVTLANLRISDGRFDDAAAEIAAMAKAYPGDVRVAYLEALLAFRQGDAAKARDAVQLVLRVTPDHFPSLLLAGAANYRLGSFNAAAEHLRLALSRNPRSAEARALLISAHLADGHPERAQALLDAALRGEPNDPRLLALAGATALASNDLAKATQHYQRAAELDKHTASTRVRLAQVRLALGDTDRAAKDLDIASGLDAKGYEADLGLIAAHLRRKDFGLALQAAAALERKQPENPLTHNVKGVVYMAVGDPKSARASFAKALELKYDYLPAAANLARLDIAEKNVEAARGRYEAIIAKQPKNEGAIIGLAGVQEATGASAKDVLATLQRAVAANPASIPAKLALAKTQLRAGDAKGALATLQAAVATNPDDAVVLELLGVAQHRAGDNNQAIETYKKLAALQPNAPGPLVRLASLQMAVKDTNAAIGTLKKALALNPDSLDLRRDIARLQVASGKSDQALAEARALQREAPKGAAGFTVEGDIYAAQKDWNRAVGAYREAMKRQPSAMLVTRLHTALESQGKAQDAKALLTQWGQDHPKDTVVRTYLAERALRERNYQEAARLYREILPLQPENPALLNNLAWAAAESKDPSAIGYAKQAYALAPESPDVLDTYGWLLLQQGEVKRAVQLLAAAVVRAPTNPAIRLHLAKGLIAASDKAAARKEIEALLAMELGARQRTEAQALLRGL